jgi:hypothetical protein
VHASSVAILFASDSLWLTHAYLLSNQGPVEDDRVTRWQNHQGTMLPRTLMHGGDTTPRT